MYKYIYIQYTLKFSHLADAFIQSDLQMRTMEAIKINKRAMICKSYDKLSRRKKFVLCYLV